MFRKMLTGVIAFMFVTGAAVSAQKGSIVRVDEKTQQIEVRVGEKLHLVTASAVKLFDSEGKRAKLTDFAVGDEVEVTMKKGVITAVRRVKAKSDGLAKSAVSAQKGSIVRVDGKTQQIEVKVGEKLHLVTASAVKLFDSEGKKAKLTDFAVGDEVEVTMKKGVIIAIRRVKAK